MPISRMDLADAGLPEALVKRILQAEPNLPVPVPIQELCARLGILGIEDLDSDAFEGGLVTDAKRSEGTILVRRGSEPRRRFTVAHELSHFLMAHHFPDKPGRFLCKSSDLLRLTAKAGDQRQRREVEANRFAILLLMPPHLLREARAALASPICSTFSGLRATSRSTRRRLGPMCSTTPGGLPSSWWETAGYGGATAASPFRL